MKISKNLVSAVLNIKVEKTGVKDNLLLYTIDGIEMKKLNLYEFLYMNCKEWALSKGYEILVSKTRTSIYIGSEITPIHIELNNKNDYDIMNTIKACEWILDND